MPERRFRVLAIASHPIQYAVPIFRLMAQDPRLDFHVAYCTLRGAEAAHDPEFGRSVQWDVPLLDGYKWTHVPNQGTGGESFFGLHNPGLWKVIREGHFDTVLCQLGYLRSSFWISYFGARARRTPFMFLTDASSMEARDGRKWKIWVKKLAWPVLFRMFNQVLTASSAGSDMMRSLRIPERKITMTLDTVDNDWWRGEAARVNRAAVRASWGLDNAEKIVLFCAKLQPWKRPLDLLRAFAAAKIPQSTLLFAGDGPLRASIEAEASTLGLGQRVRVLGFVNQSQLPAVYKASDIMVIPSEYEPFGLVVNEAMLCGCGVIASDKVGAVRDLIFPGRTGYVYPCGDTRALSATLREAFADPARLSEIGLAARQRIEQWSPGASATALTEVIVRIAAGSAQVSRQGNGDAADSAFNADRYMPS
jgi:glycosyltransferase involved in cell wall biosynthesis